MAVLKTVLVIVYAIICIALTIVVLMQEGKSAGLTGSISGMADTYWGKNKGRSMEGAMEKSTRILAILFIVLSVVLNLNLNW
ncbi:preprotein translocase subunit SecG [Anaerosporobacter faecicola]|uniref:preprotein translocase subunit SecG n=1 Tax=Anaerosporobacter faecicola TaxID=2718714 RepID=UPI00143B8C11|nr:preprotein translocase subunit SecG [Anaerosporobacter faecicola]